MLKKCGAFTSLQQRNKLKVVEDKRDRLLMGRLVILFVISFSIHAEEITGVARIIDGDSIRIDDVEIRLHGIDAVEWNQYCRRESFDWACGEAATKAMKQLVGSENIRCTWTERDRYERALASCYKDGADIASLMVDSGMALAYRRYAETYVPNEENAKATKKGVWNTEFVTPWDWRRGIRLAGQDFPGSDCPVKGNVNRKGERIYHIKGWPGHAKVRLKEAEGDSCFQTKIDAELAGFRPPKR